MLASILPAAVHTGTAALISFGYFSARACVMKLPYDAPQAITDLVFSVALFFTQAISSTLAWIAFSVAHPCSGKLEPATA